MLEAWNDAFIRAIAPLGWTGEAIVKLLLSAFLAGLVGLEREFRGREAGFRTNMLVGVGCTLVMLVSMRFADLPWTPRGNNVVTVDPARIAYGVMTGIGFLGAGAIIKYGTTIRGLTTAAALWCVAAIGLACGIGQYILSLAAAVIVMLILSLLDILEHAIPTRHFRKLTFRCPWGPQVMSALVEHLQKSGVQVGDRDFKRMPDANEMEIDLTISFVGWKTYRKVEHDLAYDSNWKLISSQRA